VVFLVPLIKLFAGVDVKQGGDFHDVRYM